MTARFRPTLLFAAVALLVGAGCASEPAPEAEALAPETRSLRSVPPSVAARPAADTADEATAALTAALGAYFESNAATPTDEYDTALADLNGDGQDDALVYLRASDWCGSGGCTLLVFERTDATAFRFVSETSLVNGPVVIGEARTNGWRDLLIPDPGEDRTLALQFSGTAYPEDPQGPTVDPSTGGQTVFEGEVGLF